LDAAVVTETVERMTEFLRPYAALFPRAEHGGHCHMYIEGRMRHLPRRTLEPIAVENGVPRRGLQRFVGAGAWSDDPLRDEMCRQIAVGTGARNGVLILDGSGFQKAGPHSVGTQKQWCGRLGKEEVCQVGEFMAYAASGSVTLADCHLYLPKPWAADTELRTKCHVPDDVTFKTGWQLGAEMVLGRGRLLPHRWVVGDESYGRPVKMRDLLWRNDEPYVLEVNSDAKVRLARGGDWTTAKAWAATLPKRAWTRFTVRDGEKGPISVRAAKVRVYTPREDKKDERPEVLLVVHNDRDSKTWTYLCSDTRYALKELVRAAACRHGVEQALTMAKGDIGLDEYEVRSWVGWHHHMTLSMMALWFLVREQRTIKKTHPRSRSHRSDASSRSPLRRRGTRSPSPKPSRISFVVLKRRVGVPGPNGVVDYRRGPRRALRWIERIHNGQGALHNEPAQYN
jgi:SRSO17 transposase